MDPMPLNSKDRPKRVLSACLPAAVGPMLLLFVLPLGSSVARADDQAPASSEKSGRQQGSPESEKSATSQPSATPSPKPSPTPKVPAPQAKRPGTAARSAQPAQTPDTALRFDDFDLEKYHKPIPQPDDEPQSDEEAGPAASPGPVPGPTPAPVKATKGQARPRPRGITAQTNEDPLKPYKDREAKEKFRQMQIETARERIVKLQGRLDYLNAKKNALQNPAPLLAGQTRGPGTPPTPIQGPGKVAIGGFFPPLPPPQTDEDKENDKKLKVKDLIDQVDTEIKSVQEELDTAQAELASVETRFAQESTGR